MSNNHSKHVGLHVDDIWCPVRDSESANIVHELFDLFEQASGMQVNKKKTFVLNQINNDLFNYAPIPSTGFAHLGIPVGPEGIFFDSAAHIQRAASTALCLSNLHLTVDGFKNLAHSYLHSVVNYQLYILSPPLNFFKTFTRICSNMLWSGRAKVSHERLIQSKEDSGIGLWSIKSRSLALKASLLHRILRDPSPLTSLIKSFPPLPQISCPYP